MINLRLILPFFIILIFFSPVQSSQTTLLNKLFNELSEVNDYKKAKIIEKKIWVTWHTHPKNNELTDKLEFGTELMYEGDYNYALKVFNNIIRTDPLWSEGWNKRATLLFFMNNLNQSLDDIEIVLDIEPRHFGALSGQARIFIKLEEYEKAINSLKKTLEFYPLFESGKLIIEIERLIKEKSI
ncbi:2-hydroxy-6-oxo-2,4-heptadienoate hydrolase [Candidatus Pelagibacter sp.]|nr:2-hydroxy-6-oxo-2,4-heptadienoate hydrolase [Candidatus Pelagibacter sp.]